MLQIRTSKSVLRYFPNAAILHIHTEQMPQHGTNLALTLTAVTLNHHHPLPLIAGD